MYTIEDIVHHTGIPEGKAMEVCNLLCSEGYLIFSKETGKYRLTKDRDILNTLRKLKAQYKNEHLFEQMCSKIEDIITFGKPLALSEKGPGVTVQDVGIPGLNIIFNSIEAVKEADKYAQSIQRIPGLPSGHCLLIKGEPGTGKTTMGMQIALCLKEFRARFLTFEEDINQLFNDFKGYLQKEDDFGYPLGWKKSDIREVTRSLIKIRTPSAWEDPDVVLNELISILDRELPHLIVIDSISRFRDIAGETKSRLLLRKLIRNLKCRRITAFFTGEDRGEENPFEEYEVDGIINLKWEGDLLTLKVKKLRGLKAYKGPHSAALMSVDDLELPEHRLISETTLHGKSNKTPYLTVGLNVFPDISVFKDLPRKEEPPLSEVISTGTIGLDDLLPLSFKEGKGFERGETILLVGSAGSGKTLLALNFMRDGYISKQGKVENTIWLNFEGDLGTLKFATRGFEKPYRSDFDKMLELGENKETGSRFEFIDFPPINLDLNKIVFTLEAICSNYVRIDRLVIDSITELEKAKGGGQPAVKVFLTGLIQFLRDRGITTVFVCRSDAFFKSIDKIEEQISSLVDLIICIRNFDVHNEIHKGIYIQKARGRKHHSKIIRMIIDSKEGIMIEDSGWDIENLLAGDTSNIDTPRIFFKLFYENPAEETINKKIIDDFDKDRYPGDEPKFTLVKKPSVYTEFWSFRGQFSAGHANTRVLSIADHVLSAFRDNNRLLELDKYVKSELLQIIASEPHLKRLNPTPNESSETEFDLGNIDAIPCYRDFGVMVFKELSTFERLLDQKTGSKQFLQGLSDFLEKIKEGRLEKQPEIGKDDNKWKIAKYTWDELLEQLRNINKKKGNENYNIVPFAFPPLDNKAEFVAFFMELLWSHGGDIYEIAIGEKYITSGYEDKFKQAIKESILKEFFCYYKKLYQKINEEIYGSGSEESQVKNKDVIAAFNEITPRTQSLIENFEQRVEIYGLKLKKIDIQEFKDWILKKLEDSDWIKDEDIESKIKKDSALKLDDKPFKETIKLMLRLVHQGGVINPIEGEFRHRALLSRNWYSRISQPGKEQCNRCTEPQLENCPNFSKSNKDECRSEYLSLYQQGKYSLLPLPLAAIKLDDKGEMKYSRSVTCLTYWSLVMLKNALSPEIGGNFIESINAPDYYESRLSDRSGMPVANWEVKKEKFRQFDPHAYSILGRILNNGFENIKTLREIGNHFKETKDNQKDRKKYEKLEKIFKKENAFVRREFLEAFKNEDHLKKYFADNKEKINKRAFYHKVRQTRIAFYQLEQALHYQLRQLFIPDHNFREELLYKDDIYQVAKKLCDEEWELKSKELKEDAQKKLENIEEKWEKYLDKIKDEFRLHVIFELLTYFFHDYMTGAGD